MEAVAWILLGCIAYLAGVVVLLGLCWAAGRDHPQPPRTRDHYTEAS